MKRALRLLALCLAPDLRDIARRVHAVEGGVNVVRHRLEDLRDQPHSPGVLVAMLDEAVDDLIEGQVRLIGIHDDLTGRGPHHQTADDLAPILKGG